jgi:chondroitin 4-sulfotransferase 11
VVVSRRLGCAFVHVQRTGGDSLEAALVAADAEAITALPGLPSWEDASRRRHLYASDLAAALGASEWGSLFSFGFVRNPWERLVSWHAMCLERPDINAFTRHVADELRDFTDFVERAGSGPASKTTVSQLDYVTDERGRPLVSFIGRFERLEADVAEVSRRLGVLLRLGHRNASSHSGYREYYSRRTRQVVGERFAPEIEAFGYRF